MKMKRCPVCGQPMKRNGRTSAGTQRWRCRECGSSAVHANDVAARDLKAFLAWLTSKDVQRNMPGQGRSFRRRNERLWRIWPVPHAVEESHRVVYVDGIYIARDLVVLIACTEDHVLSWYMARSESKRAWAALLSRIEPPAMVVSDGGQGFASAVRQEWPGTRVQRCVYNAFCQVRRLMLALTYK